MRSPTYPLARIARIVAVHLLSGRHWKLKAIAASMMTVALLAPPNLTTLFHYIQKPRVYPPTPQSPDLDRWDALSLKIHEPFIELSRYFNPSRQEANRTFRFAIPLIAHYLGLGTGGTLALGILSGPLTFYAILILARRHRAGRLLSFTLCLLAASLYLGQAWLSELNGCFDGWAYCFILMALVATNPVSVFGFVILTAFTDERALAASPLIWLYHLLRLSGPRAVTFRAVFHPVLISILVAWCSVLASRYLLAKEFNWELKNWTEATFLFSDRTLAYFFLYFFSTWKFALYLLPFGLWTLLKRKNQAIPTILLMGGILTSSIIALMPLDQTRGLSNSTPYLFVLFVALQQSGTTNSALLRWLWPCAIFSLLTPNIATYDTIRCVRWLPAEMMNLWHFIAR